VSPETLAQFKEALYGAGDVVWPAGLALARLIAHCPSLVAGKRVLEVGAGLGVVGNAALRAGASAVCMCDVDGDMLRLAKASALENAPEDPSRAATLVLDWSAIPETFCVSVGEKYDVVVAADVLYDASAARCVSDVVGRATKPGGMALLCDPENRTHRETFADGAIALGWETVEADFPGRSDMRLLQATRVEIKKQEA
jgi:predicted nicotinamide N-methyase